MTSINEERIDVVMRKIAKMRFNQSNDRNDMMMVALKHAVVFYFRQKDVFALREILYHI